MLQKNGELEEKIGEYKKAFKGIDNEKIKLLDETEANKNLMHIIDKAGRRVRWWQWLT